MMYDYLVVGAGLAGSIISERIASQLKKKVFVIDRRNHIAGNCFDYCDDAGVNVHKYGPHAFHTNNLKVWEYLSQFTDWTPYEHKVLAVIDGIKAPVPFNLNSIDKIFPPAEAKRLVNLLIDTFGMNKKIPILELMENKNPDLKKLADFIYRNIFLGYNIKQWGLKPEELDFSVSSRVPVYISRDDRYFQDMYQAEPAQGFTKMVERIISNKNIDVILQKDYKTIHNEIHFDKLIYTGPIDEFFDYIHGRLPYRSLLFDFRTLDMEWFQETAQVNYPNDNDYTRITEFKHFLGQKLPSTTIAYEYPKEYMSGENEPYYPIPRKENDEIYSKYLSEAEKLADNVIFVGRLAEYKYYNMDQIISVALETFEKKIAWG